MNSTSNWEVYFKPQALEDLERLPYTIQKRIADKVRFFVSSGNPLKFAKVLAEKKIGGFRFRIGDYRVIFDVVKNKKIIIILKIAKRDEIYKD